jgi:lipase
VTLAVHEWGDPDAPRIVCLHGVTSHGRHFERLAQRLAPRFRVLAPDLLGHGDSRREPPWSNEAHLEAILATVGREPAIWIGHSYGARLELELAAHEPECVERIVLLEPAVFLLPAIALFVAENARKERAYASFAEGIDKRYEESVLQSAPRQVLEAELATHLVFDDDGLWRYRYSQAAVVTAYGEMAREPPTFDQARVPTLIVRGASSYLSYDHLLDAHRNALGDLLHATTVDGGHTLLWDAFDETAAAIEAFLGEVEIRRPE